MAKANQPKGLGRGLGALLGDDAFVTGEAAGQTHTLPLNRIETCASQPRRYFDDGALEELAESIRSHGILQPLTVRKLQSGYYQIVAGERRWRAARLAGLTEVPVLIIEADDRTAMELAMIENLQREDLNPMEEAEGYRALTEQYGLTQESVAERVGKSRSAVTNAMRLLSLAPAVRKMVEDGAISAGHARALLPLTQSLQKKAAEEILQKKLNVREAELLAKRYAAGGKKPEKDGQKDSLRSFYADEAARELTEHLGRGCRIVCGKRSGRIELSYSGDDDLNALLEALKSLSGGKR